MKQPQEHEADPYTVIFDPPTPFMRSLNENAALGEANLIRLRVTVDLDALLRDLDAPEGIKDQLATHGALTGRVAAAVWGELRSWLDFDGVIEDIFRNEAEHLVPDLDDYYQAKRTPWRPRPPLDWTPVPEPRLSWWQRFVRWWFPF